LSKLAHASGADWRYLPCAMKKFFGFGSGTPPPPPPPPPLRPATPAPKATAPAKTPAAGAASIVGRWKEPSAAETTEFHADGTVTERSGGETIRGRYVLAGDNLKINLDGVADELSFIVTVKGDRMDMKEPDGRSTHYEKLN